VVRVTDVPQEAGGRAYLVERGLEQDGNAALEALIADYLSQATVHGVIPMLRCPLTEPDSSIAEELQR
jgi:hypothetical protein